MGLDTRLAGGPPPPSRETLGKLAALLERQGISIDEIGKLSRVSVYQSLTKNEDGEAEIHDLLGVQFSPAWESGPQWPVVQPGPQVKLPASKVKVRKETGWKKAMILPDIQAGYFRLGEDELEPTHDEAALEVVMGLIRDVQPDVIVLVGDNADFPEFGKYRLSPAFQRTTQATIDRLTLLCGQIRHAAGADCRVVWLAGNHEERLPNYLMDNAMAAFGIKRGGASEEWPVLSVPYLCRFEEFQIEYKPGYPASSFWINERLRVIHGHKHNSSGLTATKYLNTEAKSSVIYGHIHRREYAARTRMDHDGPRTIMAASPGCLCRIDGVVPSTKGGVDLDGRPIGGQVEDWQQACGVVHYQEDGEQLFVYEQVAIHEGWAFYNGKHYRSAVTNTGQDLE